MGGSGGFAARSSLAAAMEEAEAASSLGVGLQPAAAAAVAARGVLYANSQLEPNAWQPICMSQSAAAHNASIACRVSQPSPHRCAQRDSERCIGEKVCRGI